MATPTTSGSRPAAGAMPSAKQQFLDAYDREHARTMRVLRAYPTDKLDLRPHPKLRTARELAWVFVLERGLGTKVYHDEFASQGPSGTPPKPPQSWDDLLGALEKAHKDFRDLIRSTPDQKLLEKVHFFTPPKTMGGSQELTGSGFCSQTRSTTVGNSPST